jgi:hypothetical protein
MKEVKRKKAVAAYRKQQRVGNLINKYKMAISRNQNVKENTIKLQELLGETKPKLLKEKA